MSKNNQIRPGDIVAKLNQPGPTASTFDARKLPAPDREMPITLTLDELRPYDRNPRTLRNPKFDEIKESIRAVGLRQKIAVTQRPGDDKYIISDGGNTRYTVLNELWQETGDERFYRLDCHFAPWRGEINILAGHLAENANRGSLSWIENARGVYEAKRMLEQSEGKELSQRTLATQLRELGYAVDQSRISRMLYTVEYLLPTLRQPLESGMGQPQVQKLITLRNFCESFWDRCKDYWQRHTEAPGDGTEWHDQLLSGDFATAWHEEMSAFDVDGITELDWSHVETRIKGLLNDWTGVHFNILDMIWLDWFDSRSNHKTDDIWAPVDAELDRLRDPHAFSPVSPDTSERKPRKSAASETEGLPPTQATEDSGLNDEAEDIHFPEGHSAAESHASSGGESEELERLRSRLADAERQLAYRQSEVTTSKEQDDGLDDSFLSQFDSTLDDENADDDAALSPEEAEERRNALTESHYEETAGHRQFRHYMAQQAGEVAFDFEAAALQAVPLMSAGPIAPITDVWSVPRMARQVVPLRTQICECIRALAEWAEIPASGDSDVIRLNAHAGIGYELYPLPDASSRRAQLVWQLLAGLQGTPDPSLPSDISIFGELTGTHAVSDVRLPDGLLIRLWRLMRLVRVLHDTINNEDAESNNVESAS
ncbi:ParB family protein [Carnimonas bestiolae]|uniref:ParB family protein n=1 Tax=Carnimonas bestiolae TaxID=3402172 RepID=UPI003EDC5F1E